MYDYGDGRGFCGVSDSLYRVDNTRENGEMEKKRLIGDSPDASLRYSVGMAKVVDPRNLPDTRVFIPGLKPPVQDFSPSEDGDPSEVDDFNRMIRELRNQSPAVRAEMK